MMKKHERLRQARIEAGFPTAAAAATRFGWTYPTYAGHENGSRGIRPDELLVYAKAFKVPVGWLLGETNAPAPTKEPGKAAQRGFSDNDLVPFRHRTGEMLAKAVAPLSRHQIVYRCARDYLGFAVRKGDLLVVGTPENDEAEGLVVVNLTDDTLGYAVTVLRHMKKNVLLAPLSEELPDEDDLEPAILGHVLAVIRAPQLTDEDQPRP
jgi:transcriptional regulator with XRE-family HTH domain